MHKREGRDIFQMRGAAETIRAVEAWCATQRPVPSLSEAVKLLVKKGIEADAKRSRKSDQK